MLRNRYGDIFKVRMGNDMTVNICHPEIAEELLRLPSKENERVVLAIAETMYKRNNIKARALSQLWVASLLKSQIKITKKVTDGWYDYIHCIFNLDEMWYFETANKKFFFM